MPTTKHKRKASAHSKPKTVKKDHSTGLISLHPKAFVLSGCFLIALGGYLLAFESQNNAMFGIAMLTLMVGMITTIYANFAIPKKKQ
jgi:hypothetical protein